MPSLFCHLQNNLVPPSSAPPTHYPLPLSSPSFLVPWSHISSVRLPDCPLRDYGEANSRDCHHNCSLVPPSHIVRPRHTQLPHLLPQEGVFPSPNPVTLPSLEPTNHRSRPSFLVTLWTLSMTSIHSSRCISSSTTRLALRLVASVLELWGGVTNMYALTYIP